MGHFLDVGAFLNEARSTPKNGHRQFDPLLPKSANSGLILAPVANAGAVGPVSVPFLLHRQSGCGPDRHKASGSAPPFEAHPQIGRSQLSEAEAQSDRGSDVVALEKAEGQSAIHLREHDPGIEIPLWCKPPIDSGRDPVERPGAEARNQRLGCQGPISVQQSPPTNLNATA